MSRLWLDDVRPAPVGWHHARNYAEFIAFLDERGCPTVVSFDHDLAPEHYSGPQYGSAPCSEPTGLDCARAMIRRGFIPERIVVHSWNPAGAQHIAEAFAKVRDVEVLPYGIPEHMTRFVRKAEEPTNGK